MAVISWIWPKHLIKEKWHGSGHSTVNNLYLWGHDMIVKAWVRNIKGGPWNRRKYLQIIYQKPEFPYVNTTNKNKQNPFTFQH